MDKQFPANGLHGRIGQNAVLPVEEVRLTEQELMQVVHCMEVEVASIPNVHLENLMKQKIAISKRKNAMIIRAQVN